MQNKNKIQLELGQKLFHYVSFKGVFVYVVTGKREYENSNSFYEIECQECNDHKKCKILISQTDNIRQFHYVSMVDEDEENEQYFWHWDGNYFLSKASCLKHAYKKSLERQKEEIEKLKNELKKKQERLAEIQSLIDGCVE